MPEINPSRYTVHATWDDVPHLSAKAKEEMLRSIPPHMRDARSKGLPHIGPGLIYPVSEASIKIEPFAVPHSWPRCYGLDVGLGTTAALWLAIDRNTMSVYGYAEHYRKHELPPVHATAIKARGEWIPGAIDPSSRNRSPTDGRALLSMYEAHGLILTPANNDVETGLTTVWELLATGRLKIFSTCQKFFEEYRVYRRDDKGKVIKKFDHLMDAVRYGVMTGLAIAKVPPARNDTLVQLGIVDSRAGY